MRICQKMQSNPRPIIPYKHGYLLVLSKDTLEQGNMICIQLHYKVYMHMYMYVTHWATNDSSSTYSPKKYSLKSAGVSYNESSGHLYVT